MIQSQPVMQAAPLMQQSVMYSVPTTQTVAQPVFGSMPVLQPVMQRPEMVQFGSMPVLQQYPGSMMVGQQQYPGSVMVEQQYPGVPVEQRYLGMAEEEERLEQDAGLRADSPSRVIQ
mmetsp:Transcript_46945/g.124224  ORF Transcript_46945/g.124224 Transcript_46945/m.124224 type:complete len:117 (+) Transcript_46945:1544-1894(+)